MFTNFLQENKEVEVEFSGDIFNKSMLVREDVDTRDLEMLMLEAELEFSQNIKLMLMAEATHNPEGATATANIAKATDGGDEKALTEATEQLTAVTTALTEAEDGLWVKIVAFIKKTWESIQAFFKKILMSVTAGRADKAKWVKDNDKKIKDGVAAYSKLDAAAKKKYDEKEVPLFTPSHLADKLMKIPTATEGDSGDTVQTVVADSNKKTKGKSFAASVTSAVSFFNSVGSASDIKKAIADANTNTKKAISDLESNAKKKDMAATDKAKKHLSAVNAKTIKSLNAVVSISNNIGNCHWKILKAAAGLAGSSKPVKEDVDAAAAAEAAKAAGVAPGDVVKEDVAVVKEDNKDNKELANPLDRYNKYLN